MNAHLLGPVILAVIVLGGITFGLWMECREDVRTRTPDRTPSHPAAKAMRRVPGIPVDGRPLSPGERDEFIGCLFASDARYAPAEPDYGGRSRG